MKQQMVVVAAWLSSGCLLVPETVRERQLLQEHLGQLRPAGEPVIWLSGTAERRGINVAATEARACARVSSRTFSEHAHKTARLAVAPASGTDPLYLAALLLVDVVVFPISALVTGIVVWSSHDEYRTLEEATPDAVGVCTRAV